MELGISRDSYIHSSSLLIKEILKKEAKSKKRSGDIRTYEDLIYGRFKLDKTVIIERQDDKNSISNKWADFTPQTIDKLIREGENYEKTSTVRIL